MARLVPLVSDEIYHVFNRGVDKRDIFLREIDYRRFLLVANLVNSELSGHLHIERGLSELGQCRGLSNLPEYLGTREEFASIIDSGQILDYFENSDERYYLKCFILICYQR